MTARRRRHPTRWVAGAVLVVLVVVGIVLATRTPQEATAVSSPLLGQRAPALLGPDLTTGAPVSLASLRGHYVVVNFFASWCIPCQQEAPDLSRFHYEQTHRGGRGRHGERRLPRHRRRRARAFLQPNGDLWPAVGDPGGTIAERLRRDGAADDLRHRPGWPRHRVLEGPATQKNLDSFLAAAARRRQAGASNG